MKKHFLITSALLATAYVAALGQDQIKIRIERNVDGQTEVIEKSIDATGMSEDEKNAAIDSLFSSEGLKNRKMEFMFEHAVSENDVFGYDEEQALPDTRMRRKYPKGGGFNRDDFRFEMERLGEEMRKLGEEMPLRFQRNFPRVYAWTDDVLSEVTTPSGIRSLEVFTNKPENNTVNVRFFTPKEDDVTITVVDSKGKQVAQREVKKFKGEYVGQLELKRATKGTYFVIVSQGGDGVNRKVVIE
jgi:hypothetical protein